ncbi:hypothetical protein D3C76_1562400 [compost metagenome]
MVQGQRPGSLDEGIDGQPLLVGRLQQLRALLAAEPGVVVVDHRMRCSADLRAVSGQRCGLFQALELGLPELLRG